jgi:hypothetical protein
MKFMFKKKPAKKLIFGPQIAMRAGRFDTARNQYFGANFLNARFQCSQLLRNCGKIKVVWFIGGRCCER